MKYCIAIVLLYVSLLPLLAQQVDSTQNSKQDSITLLEAINALESSTDYHFYYRNAWLDSIYVSQSALQYKLPEQLDNLLSATMLGYYVIDDKIILLNDTRIITEPAIASFFDEKADVEEVGEELFISRNLNKKDSELETRLNKVGNKNRYIPNAKSTVTGFVKEYDTENPVEGVFVYFQNPYIGTITNKSGFYSISVPNGRRKLILQSINMKNTSRELMVFSDGQFNMEMEVDIIALNAVEIRANREENVKSTQMGLSRIDAKSIKIMPALLGEKDIIKVATTTAGVQFLGEGSAGINIRGGKADQNLFLLDGTPVYNTNHFFGFFSVFNSDALEGMDLYKSAVPSEFGGRLSSVFNISSKEPNKEKFSGSGGIGPVASRLMLETPIGKKGLSIMLGGRATYSDFVLKKIKNSSLQNNKVSFNDLLAKVDYKINKKNTLSITSYISNDKFQLSADTLLSFTDFSYSNRVLSLKWKHIFNDNLLGYFHVGSSNYAYNIGFDVQATQAFNIDFGLRENLFSAKFDKYLDEKTNLKFGVEVKHLKVNPGVKSPIGTESLIVDDAVDKEHGLEINPFVSATYNHSDNLTIEAGMRYSIYNVIGSATVNEYLQDAPREAEFISSIRKYKSGESIKTYHGLEPRISSRYSLSENTSLKASYGRTRQNVHLLLNAASVAPTDIWRLSSSHIKPQIADQVSLGYYRNFYRKHAIETSVELYYKKIQNLLDFKVGSDLQFNKAIEQDVIQGDGKSYGLELSVKKSDGWLTGWFNYTYSRSLIRLDGDFPEEVINGGVYFPTGYDKPHYFNAITNYKFTSRFTMTLNTVFATGVPATVPLGKWKYKGAENILYSNRNEYRIPNYFRLDLGINIEGSHKVAKLAHSSWTFSVYNILGIDNIFSVFFKVEDGKVKGYKMSVFPTPIPTITYNFSF